MRGGKDMKLFNIVLVPCSSASDFYLRFRKRMLFHVFVEAVKLIFILAVVVFFLGGYLSPMLRASLHIDVSDKIRGLLSSAKSTDDRNTQEVLNLASMIRWITEGQLPEGRVLRYAGLIFHASHKYSVNPLEIIALIMAESGFKENSINKETGDYGLGQINWHHWGKDYGFTPQELLDPSINIFLTCHVYKFFGEDFGRYHRGDGIKCRAYLVNVKGILSSLNAYARSS